MNHRYLSDFVAKVVLADVPVINTDTLAPVTMCKFGNCFCKQAVFKELIHKAIMIVNDTLLTFLFACVVYPNMYDWNWSCQYNEKRVDHRPLKLVTDNSMPLPQLNANILSSFPLKSLQPLYEVTYPLSNFNGCSVEVWQWINNFFSLIRSMWLLIHSWIKGKSF